MKPFKDPAKLTSINESGGKLRIIPAEVDGFFRHWRSRAQTVLIGVFLLLPWTTINGQQLILLNVGERRFHLFGLVFRAHDTPLIFFLLIIATLGLAFVTALWGRIWCGWACPQTVFVDGLFRQIELWTEGSYLERRKLAASPLSWKKIRMTGSKWLLFIIASSIIAHSFIALFSGSKELLQMMQRPPAENWNYFILVTVISSALLFNLAWFREQFCVIMCPYGRIQSVLLEGGSLAITYDSARGEPRKINGATFGPSGDCVSCNKCVEVCPTGIDIRNGLQMECIGCTACVDACDSVMKKLKRPIGLIGYKTIDGSPFRWLKAKTVVYGFFISAAFLGIGSAVLNRSDYNITVLRALEAPYTVTKDPFGKEKVLNHFRLHITNQVSRPTTYQISLPESERLRGLNITVAQNPFVLKAYESSTWHVFISAPVEQFTINGNLKSRFILTDSKGQSNDNEVLLLGPKK